MNHLAKTWIGLGVALVLAGAALLVLQRLGLGRLPQPAAQPRADVAVEPVAG